MKRKENVIVWLYFISLVLIWGSTFILVKNGLKGYTAAQSATLRLVSAFVVMSFFAVRHLQKIRKKKIPVIMFVGFMTLFVPVYLLTAAQEHIDSAMAGILSTMTPLFTSLIALTFFGKHITKFQWLGLSIGFLSAAFLLMISSSASISINQYALLVIGTTICYGLSINIVKEYLGDVDSFHISTVAVSFAGLLGLVVLFFSGYENYIEVESQQVFPLLSLITLGVLGTALAQFLQNQLIQKSSAVFASSTTYAIPLVAIFWGLIDGEKLGFAHLIGIFGILCGVFILNRAGKSKFSVKMPEKRIEEPS